MSGPTLDFWKLWQPLPRQREFLAASRLYRYLLYGGSRGSGKSSLLRWGMLWKLLDWASKGRQGVRVGLFSEDYPTLEDRQISKIEREFPKWLGHLGTTKSDGLGFYLAPEYGGGVITLRNLDDPSKYVGGEFAGIGIEELTRLKRSTFDLVRGSLRWPGLSDTFFWSVTNPLGPGLLWVRDLWVERKFPKELAALAPQFHFIRAYPSDNSHLTPDYWEDLRSQPEYVQRAWIDGDWYVPVGVMFSEVRPETHRVPAGPPSPESTIEIMCDWGWEHDAVALWIETTPTQHRVYREYAANHTTPVEWAEEVVRRTGKERIARLCIDSAANQRTQDGRTSPFEQMVPVFYAAGIGSQLVEKRGAASVSSRPYGWQLLHEWLRHRDGGPALVIADDCPVLWKQLTTIVRGEPPHNIEDTAPNQVDDALTALRYWALMRPPQNPAGPAQTALYDENRHPGIDYNRHATRRPWETAYDPNGLEPLTSFEDGQPAQDRGAPVDWHGEPLVRLSDGDWL